MSEWREIVLDEFIKLQRGYDLATPKRTPGSIPVIGAGGISGWHDTPMAKGPGVVVGRAGASMGYATYSPKDFWPLNTSLFVTDFCGNNPRFAYYLLTQLDFSGFNSGAAHPMLNRNYIKNIALVVPSPPEQRKIAAVLGALDDKITVNDRTARTCHELAQARLLKAKPYASLAALNEIARITMGSSPPGESYNEDGIGMPFYQGTRDFGDRSPSHRVWCSVPVRTAPEGSTLVSVRAPVGRVNMAREWCCIGRGVAVAESTRSTPSVLFHTLAGESDIWAPYESEGTVFGAINKQQLALIRVPTLEDEVARALETVLNPLDQCVAAANEENHALAELRDLLLPKLMSGEIRVKDAEKVVGDAT